MGRFSCQGRRRLSHYLLTSSGVNPRRTGRSAIGLFVRFEFFEAKRNERSGKPGTATPSGAKENNNINQNATITTTTIRRTQTHTHTRTHTHTDTPTQPHTHTHKRVQTKKTNSSWCPVVAIGKLQREWRSMRDFLLDALFRIILLLFVYHSWRSFSLLTCPVWMISPLPLLFSNKNGRDGHFLCYEGCYSRPLTRWHPVKPCITPWRATSAEK